MPGIEHRLITEAAVSCLPDWQQTIIEAEKENLISEYSRYPDQYFDTVKGGHNRSKPYYFETDGIQFHYIPDTPIVEKYRYWYVEDGQLKLPEQAENKNWLHARNGFEYYLQQSVDALKNNQLKDAMSFAACLLHMLEDSTYGLHSFEGVYGTDIFVLDRLFDYDDDPAKLPSKLMADSVPDIAVTYPDYTPECLGESIGETVFILYTCYVNTVLAARKLMVKIVQEKMADNDCTEYYKTMFQNSVRLMADVLNTIFCVAFNKADSGNVFLSDIEPVQRPWGLGLYRFITLLKNKAMLTNAKTVPLQLTVNGNETHFDKGMSFGSHVEWRFIYEIPRQVYQNFSCILGLQTEFIEEGEVSIQIVNDEKLAYESTFNKQNPADYIEIPNPGGVFEIYGSSPESARKKTVITLANPILHKVN